MLIIARRDLRRGGEDWAFSTLGEGLVRGERGDTCVRGDVGGAVSFGVFPLTNVGRLLLHFITKVG